MSKGLTPKQKQAYLLNPTKCPFCGEENKASAIWGKPYYGLHKKWSQDIWCSSCRKSLIGIYTLTSIEEVTDEHS